MPEDRRLGDPITLRATLKGTRSDQDGQWTVTLAIPASEAARAAELSLLKGIVFAVTITPEDAERRTPRL